LESNQRDRDSRPAVENKNFTLYVQNPGKKAPERVLGDREIEDCEQNGEHLYILGTQTNEPPGLWDYNVNSELLNCLLPALPPLRYAAFAAVTYHVTTNDLDQAVGYYIWAPTCLIPGKKYPLMLGQSTYRWVLEAEVAANSGYYFAMAERPTWSSERFRNWGEDVQSVCTALIKNENIDTNRIVLSSTSTAEGWPLQQLMENDPAFAAGAFLSGGMGPKTTCGYPANIEMLVGDKDQYFKLDALKRYLEDAAHNGIAVKIVLRNGPHSTIALENQILLAREYADFLRDNK